MSELVTIGGHGDGFGANQRTDTWWVGPLLTLMGLLAFVVYSTWAGVQGNNYWYDGGAEGFGGYLSPFYSPLLFIDPSASGAAPLHHAWIGKAPEWMLAIPLLGFSPTYLIIPFPLSFRFTCYYYRKAYYRAFTATPPACAVGARPQSRFRGETHFLVFQNLHRYALYFALAFIPILGWDAVQGFFRGGRFGVGVGSLVLTVNVVLISLYTFGCHSWRHLVGGRLDCFSCDASSETRHGIWKWVTWLNERHQLMAWCSLFWVGFTDVYIRLVASGTIPDLGTW